MRKSLALLSLCTFVGSTALAGELGLKIGSASLNWSDGTSTDFDAYVSVYGGKSISLSPLFGIDILGEIGYASLQLENYTTILYGNVNRKLTYTTLEINAQGYVSPIPGLKGYAGAGLSYNRYAIDYTDSSGNKIATDAEETATGYQGFIGIQYTFLRFAIGVEYKKKYASSQSVDGVDALTLSLAIKY